MYKSVKWYKTKIVKAPFWDRLLYRLTFGSFGKLEREVCMEGIDKGMLDEAYKNGPTLE